MNQYYYMKWDDSSQSYAIQYGPTLLPENFGITSGFNNIEKNDPGLLFDLSWTGKTAVFSKSKNKISNFIRSNSKSC
jgi:hypothetical protein